MTHAYFGIYVYMCDDSCQDIYEELIGEWGHSKCWQEVAFALEKATVPLLEIALSMDTRLNISCEPGACSAVPKVNIRQDAGQSHESVYLKGGEWNVCHQKFGVW